MRDLAEPSASAPATLASPPQLALTFASAGGRTFLAEQWATHPFHIGRLLYRPDDAPGLATVYVQGCAGGLFEHDRVAASIRVEPQARAHVTTSAATIVHRMPSGGHAVQEVALTVGAGALLEYYPDPLIMFPGSRLRSRLEVALAPAARAIVVDAWLTHRLPDDQGPFAWLACESVVRREGRVCARERYVARGDVLRAELAGVTGVHGCQVSVLVLGRGAEPLAPLRAALAEATDALLGASSLPSDVGVIVRILARDASALRRATQRVWEVAREALGERGGRARPK